MVMLEDGIRPKTYSFKDILQTYLNHITLVMRRSYEHDLRKNKEKLLILE
jgi:DNA gyrase/topoisomerase IV subunit A